MDKRLGPVAFSVPAQFATPSQDGTRRFSGIAYAGGVITDHGWFDRVAFDLATTSFATPAPALLQHSDPIGVVDKAEINGQIAVEGKLFADVEGPAKGVVEMADRGMPWQMSVYIKPGSIEEFKAGAKVTLNGQTFDGPLTVFRNSRVREVSFCALGADDQTNAQVFNARSVAPSSTGDVMPEVTQEEFDRVVNAEKALTAAEKARADQATSELEALRAQFAAQQLATRTAAVKALFADTGREYKDEAAKPYLDMPEEAFAVIAADLRAAKPKADPKLFEEHPTGVLGEVDPSNVGAIRDKAAAFIADQAKLGRSVSVADAVANVTGKFKS